MSSVLLSWCNDTLKLSITSRGEKISSLTSDFKNGYLFAELLYKVNQLPFEFPGPMIDNDRSETIISNYANLQDTFSRLGIELQGKLVSNLVTGKAGTAESVLYRLKTQLAPFERVVVGRPPTEGSKALARLEPKLAKPSYQTMTNMIFNKVLHKIVGNQRELDMAEFLQKFTHNARNEHFANIDAYNRSVLEYMRSFYQEFRKDRRSHMEILAKRERELTEKGAQEWSRNQSVRLAEVRQQRYIAMRLAAENAAKKRSLVGKDFSEFTHGTSELALLAAVHGINVEPTGAALEAQRIVPNGPPLSNSLSRDEYLAELASRLGPEGGAKPTLGRTSSGSAGVMSAQIASAVSGAGTESLSESAIHAATYRASDTAARHIVNTLQARKGSEAEAASLRTRRRRNVLAASELETERVLHKQRIEQLKSAALKPSIPETALIGVVRGVLRAEKAFIQRRQELDSLDALRRSETNWAELSRQRDVFVNIRARHDRAVQLACFTYDNCIAERNRLNEAEAISFARFIALKIVDFSTEAAKGRELLRGRSGPVSRLTGAVKALLRLGDKTRNINEEHKSSSKETDDIMALADEAQAALDEPDDGSRFDSGENDLSQSVYRDLTTMLSSDFPISAAYPDLSQSMRPLAQPGSFDMEAGVSHIALVNALRSAESAAAVAISKSTSNPSDHSLAAAAASASTAVTIAAAAVAASEANTVSVIMLRDTPEAIAMLPLAGVRGELPSEMPPSDIEGSILTEAQALLDACNLRDHLVKIGAWGEIPDYHSSQLSELAVAALEGFVSGFLVRSSNKVKLGLPALLPEIFSPVKVPEAQAPSIPIPEPTPTPAPAPSTVKSGGAPTGKAPVPAAAGARRNSAAKVEPSIIASSVSLPVSAVAQVIEDDSPPLDPFSTEGFRGINSRSSRINTALSAATESSSTPATALLASSFTQFALRQEPSAASDVLGLVVRNIEEAAQAADIRLNGPPPATAFDKAALLRPFRFPVQVAMIGPQHSGILTQSTKLADLFNLALIHPKSLLMRGVVLAWPSSNQFKKAVSEEHGSRPSSRSGVAVTSTTSVYTHVAPGTHQKGVMPLYTVPANELPSGGHGIRRPHLNAVGGRAESIDTDGGFASAQAGSLPTLSSSSIDQGDKNRRAGRKQPTHLPPPPLVVGDALPSHTASVFGIVMQTDEAPSNVPKTLISTIPVSESRLLSPLFDNELRRLGQLVLSSSAHLPMDNGRYFKDAIGIPGTVDAHVDWNKLPDSIFVECICSAITQLANVTGMAAHHVDRPAHSVSTTEGSIRGWILAGFPNSLNQARLLEKALTGFEDKGPLSKPSNTTPSAFKRDDHDPTTMRTTASDLLMAHLPQEGASPTAQSAHLMALLQESSIGADLRTSSHVFEAKSGAAARIEDSVKFWSALMAPAPEIGGAKSNVPRYEISWPHALDAVLRLDTTPERILRRALGWVADTQSIGPTTVWNKKSMNSGVRVFARQLEQTPLTLHSHAMVHGQHNSGNNPSITSTPDCPVAAVLVAMAGIDLPEQQSLHAPGSGRNQKAQPIPSVGDPAIGPPSPMSMPESLLNESSLGSASDGLYNSHMQIPLQPLYDNHMPAQHLPFVYHTDAIPPQHLHESIVTFAPIISAEMAYRPGSDGCVVFSDQQVVDLEGTALQIAKDMEAYANEVSSLDQFYSRGPGLIRVVKTWTTKRGSLAPINKRKQAAPPLQSSASISIAPVEDMVAGGQASVVPSASFDDFLTVNCVEGVGGAVEAEEEDGIDDHINTNVHFQTSTDGELDGDSYVDYRVGGGRGGITGPSSRATVSMFLPHDESAAVAASGSLRVNTVPMPPATAGEWAPARFDTLNERELTDRLASTLRLALSAKQDADNARAFAYEEALAAVTTETQLIINHRQFAQKLRSGAGIAAAEARQFMIQERSRLLAARRNAAAAAGIDLDDDEEDDEEDDLDNEDGSNLSQDAVRKANIEVDPLTLPPNADILVYRDPGSMRIAPPPLPESVILQATEIATAQEQAFAAFNAAKESKAKAGGVSFGGEKTEVQVMPSKLILPAIPHASIAFVLKSEWDTAVKTYVSEAKIAMRCLRVAEHASVARLAIVRRRVRELAGRPCPELQLPMAHFQRNWNDFGLSSGLVAGSSRALGAVADIEYVLRGAKSSKPARELIASEFLLRLEETTQGMWDAVDHREGESIARLADLVGDGWVAHAQASATACFVKLLKAEVKRFDGTRRVLLDYYSAAEGAKVAFDDFIGTALTASSEAAAKEAAALLAAAKKAPPLSRVGSRRSSTAPAVAQEAHHTKVEPASAPAPAVAKPGGKPSAPTSSKPGSASGTKPGVASPDPTSQTVGAPPQTPSASATATLEIKKSPTGLLPPLLPAESDGVDENALTDAIDPRRLHFIFSNVVNNLLKDFGGGLLSSSLVSDDKAFPGLDELDGDEFSLTATALKDPPPPESKRVTISEDEELAKSQADAAAATAAPAKPEAAGKGKPGSAAATKSTPATGKPGSGKGAAAPAPAPAPEPAPVPAPAPAPTPPVEPLGPKLYEARVLVRPLKRLITAIRAASAIADAVTACIESMVIAQARAREKRLRADRQSVRTAISNALSESTDAKIKQIEADAAAAKAALLQKQKAASSSPPASNAIVAPVKPVVKPSAAAVREFAAAAVVLEVDIGKIADEAAPSDNGSIAPSGVGVSAFLDEGLFVALRYETEKFRAGLAVILRHCAAHVNRIAKRADSCFLGAHSDIMRASMSEGACVEAFASLAKTCIIKGKPLPHELKIKQSADCAAFLVDKASRMIQISDSDSIGGGLLSIARPSTLPGVFSCIERGDLTADAEEEDEVLFDSQDGEHQARELMLGLSPHQSTLVASCLRGTAVTYSSDASGPFGAYGVAPTSTIPLNLFVDSLTRLGASGMLPAQWAHAALAAMSVSASDKEAARSSPLHILGEMFKVTEVGAGTAAAAAIAAGDAEAAAIEDVVEWRMFVASLVISGPADDMLPTNGPGSDAPIQRAYKASVASIRRNGGTVILPDVLAISNGISQPPTPDEVLTLYNAATGRTSSSSPTTSPGKTGLVEAWKSAVFDVDDSTLDGNGALDRDASLRDSSSQFQAALVLRSEVSNCGAWWFEKTNVLDSSSVRPEPSVNDRPKYYADGDVILADEYTEDDISTLRNSIDATTAFDGTSGPFSGWHHVSESHASPLAFSNDTRAGMRAFAAKEDRAQVSKETAAATSNAMRSCTIGDAAIKAVLLDTFGVYAGAVYTDPATLESKGYSESDQLVDVSGLCRALMNVSRARSSQ
jgi:hypothetical protein